jgi:hypothetical protein
MRHRQPQLLGVLARQGEQLRQLLGRELARCAAAILIGEYFDDHRFEPFIADVRRLGRRQPLAGCRPTLTPASYALRVNRHGVRLRHVRRTISASQHDLNTFREPPLDGPRSRQALQNRSLPRENLDRRGLSTHAPH